MMAMLRIWSFDMTTDDSYKKAQKAHIYIYWPSDPCAFFVVIIGSHEFHIFSSGDASPFSDRNSPAATAAGPSGGSGLHRRLRGEDGNRRASIESNRDNQHIRRR